MNFVTVNVHDTACGCKSMAVMARRQPQPQRCSDQNTSTYFFLKKKTRTAELTGVTSYTHYKLCPKSGTSIAQAKYFAFQNSFNSL